jgi:hypothetical protein
MGHWRVTGFPGHGAMKRHGMEYVGEIRNFLPRLLQQPFASKVVNLEHQTCNEYFWKRFGI